MSWIADEYALLLPLGCLGALIISALVMLIAIPRILRIAYNHNLLDRPDCERKLHEAPTPRLGGLGFYVALVLSVSVVLGVEVSLGKHLDTILSRPFYGYVGALTLMFAIGMADDLSSLKYRVKLFTQFMAALLMSVGGYCLTDFHWMFGLGELPYWVALLISMLIVALVVNAYNFIDGLDGLASALGLVASVWFGCVYIACGALIPAVISFALTGMLIPFMFYNLGGSVDKHTKIFMGDAGTALLGLTLAFLAIGVAILPGERILGYQTMVVAFVPLAIPCLDVLRVFWHRLVRHRSPFLPDRNHIHHKLLRLGFTQRQTVLRLVVAQVLLLLMNLYLSLSIGAATILLIDVAIWIIVNIVLTRRLASIETVADSVR